MTVDDQRPPSVSSCDDELDDELGDERLLMMLHNGEKQWLVVGRFLA